LKYASAVIGLQTTPISDAPGLTVDEPRLPEIQEFFQIAKDLHGDVEAKLASLGIPRNVTKVMTDPNANIEDPNDALRHLGNILKIPVWQPLKAPRRNLEITACFIDAWQLISTMGAIVVNIRTLTQVCAEPYPSNKDKRATCSSMVTLDIALFAYMGTYICNMMNTCPGVFNKEATCALGPVGLLASAMDVATGGATIAGNCLQGLTPAPTPCPKPPNPPPAPVPTPKLDHKEEKHHPFGKKAAKKEKGGFKLFKKAGEKEKTVANDELEDAVEQMAEQKGVTLGDAEVFEAIDARNGKSQEEFHRVNLGVLQGIGSIGRRLAPSVAKEIMYGLADKKKAEVEAHIKAKIDAKEAEMKNKFDKTKLGQKIIKMKAELAKKKEKWDKVAAVGQFFKDAVKRKKDKQWAITSCVFDLQKVVARLMQTGTFLGLAAIDCSDENIGKKGQLAKDLCAIDIGVAIGSAAIAANLISISVINCPATLKYLPNNLCASGILSLISASGYLAVAFAGVHDACSGFESIAGDDDEIP